jgi:hypothetical protein
LALVQYPDKKELIKEIANLLQRLSLLYQVNNWSAENSVTLAEWVFDNYKGYRINDVIECLKNPPTVQKKDGEIDNQWRLTPDTINKWMDIQTGKSEPIPSLEPEKPELPYKPVENIDKVIADHLETLRQGKISGVPRLTREEVKKEGQSDPPLKKAAANFSDPRLIELHKKKVEYGRLFSDPNSWEGKLKPGSPSFEEWLVENK